MEMWELIKRLLGYAFPGQSFSPSIVARAYLRELQDSGLGELPTADEFVDFAESISVELADIGLIENFPSGGPGPALLNGKQRTPFGEELYQSLKGRNVVALFEGMQVEIDSGEIRRVIHQLSS